MAAEQTVKVSVGIQVNYIANSSRTCVVDTGIPWPEWDEMTEAQREEVLDGCAQVEVENSVSAWAEAAQRGEE